MTIGGDLLRLEGVTKRFGGLVALDDVDLSVAEAELVGLIGPNGAGKSTLLNVISHVYPASEGRVLFRGNDVTDDSIHEIAAQGIVRTFQDAKHFEDSTGQVNLRIAQTSNRVRSREMFFGPFLRRGSDGDERREAAIDLARLSTDTLEKLPSSMTHLERSKLAIARALVNEPDLLMLDEPFAGLTADETAEIADVIVDIHETGVAVLLIDHSVGEVTDIAERVVVLDQGQVISEGEPESILEDDVTKAAYFGT